MSVVRFDAVYLTSLCYINVMLVPRLYGYLTSLFYVNVMSVLRCDAVYI